MSCWTKSGSGVGDGWYLLDCYDNYSTCGAKKPSANLLKLSTASIDIPLGYIPKGEKHIEWRVVCNRCADLCWYCDRPWNTKHLRGEELEGWWILQKHSQYCKNTANIAKTQKTQQILIWSPTVEFQTSMGGSWKFQKMMNITWSDSYKSSYCN